MYSYCSIFVLIVSYNTDTKFSSNINDIDRFEQKLSLDKKYNWPTEDSFNTAFRTNIPFTSIIIILTAMKVFI